MAMGPKWCHVGLALICPLLVMDPRLKAMGPKWCHVGLALICPFLVMDPRLKAMGPIYGSHWIQ